MSTTLIEDKLLGLLVEQHEAAQQYLRWLGDATKQPLIENRLRVVTEAITNYFEEKQKCPK